MTDAIGALLAATALLVALALSIGSQLFVDQVAGTAFAEADRGFVGILLAELQRGQQAFPWLGLVLVLAGWFAGSNKCGTAVRTSNGCVQPSSCSVRRPALGQQRVPVAAVVVAGVDARPPGLGVSPG